VLVAFAALKFLPITLPQTAHQAPILLGILMCNPSPASQAHAKCPINRGSDWQFWRSAWQKKPSGHACRGRGARRTKNKFYRKRTAPVLTLLCADRREEGFIMPKPAPANHTVQRLLAIEPGEAFTYYRGDLASSRGAPRTKKEGKARRDMLRRMIDAGVFGPPALDGRSHEW
jgi:hypothetical protein